MIALKYTEDVNVAIDATKKFLCKPIVEMLMLGPVFTDAKVLSEGIYYYLEEETMVDGSKVYHKRKIKSFTRTLTYAEANALYASLGLQWSTSDSFSTMNEKIAIAGLKAIVQSDILAGNSLNIIGSTLSFDKFEVITEI